MCAMTYWFGYADCNTCFCVSCYCEDEEEMKQSTKTTEEK